MLPELQKLPCKGIELKSSEKGRRLLVLCPSLDSCICLCTSLYRKSRHKCTSEKRCRHFCCNLRQPTHVLGSRTSCREALMAPFATRESFSKHQNFFIIFSSSHCSSSPLSISSPAFLHPLLFFILSSALLTFLRQTKTTSTNNNNTTT